MKISRIVFLCWWLIFLFLLSEISVRIYYRFFRDASFTKSVWDFYDKELGWKGKVFLGDRLTAKYNIFFIGDSFTEGCGVDEEKMYYNVIASNLDAEICVYGGPGYGTLQEYMVLDRYIDEIKPDLIVLQVCSNDFINNLWELESASFYNNDLMIRPYFINGKVVYLFPKFPSKLRMTLFSHSRLLYLLGYSIDKFLVDLCKRGFLHSVETDIYKKGINFKNFKKATIVTNVLIARIKERAGQVPIVAFTVNGHYRHLQQFRKIFRENSIEFIEEVPEAIRQGQRNGLKLTLDNDTHWNETGHKVCGEILSEKLKQKGYGIDKILN
ncbi:MAG: SGNH/GDSL hydrolase family protein [Candidatus Omnitrophica bacterium]|nr:SGNH/GDSL hydrolase family protein [Candidatus Omnitrophota bacterium]